MMIDIDTTRSMGGALAWSTIGVEALTAIHDLRWMILLIIGLIIADYYFGIRESYLHYKNASDAETKENYRFHRSRSIRRSANKFCDYMMLLLIGCLIGLGIMEPLGICDHVLTSGIGLSIGVIAEVCSIIEHFLVLKGIDVHKMSIWKGIEAFIISLTKSKSSDLGNALEDAINVGENTEKMLDEIDNKNMNPNNHIAGSNNNNSEINT